MNNKRCNYPPPLCLFGRVVLRGLFDHVGGFAVEGDLDGGEWVVALQGHGLQVAGDAAAGSSLAHGAANSS